MPPPFKSKGLRKSKGTESDKITDPRFANIETDPRFRLPSRNSTHVQIDKRFERMLRDDAFSSKAKVDRYGRKLPKDSGRQALQNYYRLGDNTDEESAADEEIERKAERAHARNEAPPSSSDESSSEDEAMDSADEDEVFGLLNEGAADDKDVPMGEPSSRIAIVNLDWDNIRAADLMVVFSSFAPTGGRILRISIYPSDFGRDRMEREETEGPPKEIFDHEPIHHDEADTLSSEDETRNAMDEQEEEEKIKKSLLREDKGEEFNSSKLRRYQLERLRYYFAVLVCSSTSVAQAIYDAVDGTEYLTTANFFDLRFIPNDADFSADKAREECERVPDGYKPNDFVTDALQHSKVRLTWDADDGTRKEVQKKAFGGSRADIDENDLKAYIGSDSSDDEVLETVVIDRASNDQSKTNAQESNISPGATRISKKDAERQRMRALLGLGSETAPKAKSPSNAHEPVGDMQVTFSSGLSSTNKGSVFENEPEPDETTLEKARRKLQERKKMRKEKKKHANSAGSGNVAVNEDVDRTATAPNQTDLGFSDPFFTAPSANSTSLKAQKRAQRRVIFDLPGADSTQRREELEVLAKNDPAAKFGQIQHFDTTLLAKGEKLASKKGIQKKKQKISERQREALEAKAKDDFQIDTQDPRFNAIFERSEYAIDPSHKGFKDTEGMKALLEAGRMKRRRDGQDVDTGLEHQAKRKKHNKSDTISQKQEVRDLCEKVRERTVAV